MDKEIIIDVVHDHLQKITLNGYLKRVAADGRMYSTVLHRIFETNLHPLKSCSHRCYINTIEINPAHNYLFKFWQKKNTLRRSFFESTLNKCIVRLDLLV